MTKEQKQIREQRQAAKARQRAQMLHQLSEIRQTQNLILQELKNQRGQKVIQPVVSLDPSDWYPKNLPVVEKPAEKKVKLVRFKRVGAPMSEQFIASAYEMRRLREMNIAFGFELFQKGVAGHADQYAVQLQPTYTTEDVGILTTQLNRLFNGRLRFYAEVRVLG